MLGYLLVGAAGFFLGGAVVELLNRRVTRLEREAHRSEVRYLREQNERLAGLGEREGP